MEQTEMLDYVLEAIKEADEETLAYIYWLLIDNETGGNL